MAKTWNGPIRPKYIAEKSNRENDFSDLFFASLDADAFQKWVLLYKKENF